MIIACLGDSLTEGDYGIPGKTGIANVRSENYPFFLSGILGCEVRNCGRCGATATTYLAAYNDLARVGGADIVLLMLGTNGGLSPTEETDGNRDYRAILARVKEDAPGAKIILLTSPRVTEEKPKVAACARDGAEFARKLARDEGYLLFDLARAVPFTEETEHIYQPNDGCHLSREGYRTVAALVADYLRTLS